MLLLLVLLVQVVVVLVLLLVQVVLLVLLELVLRILRILRILLELVLVYWIQVLLLMYVACVTQMHATMLMCCTNIGHTTRSTLAVDTVGEEPNLIISIML